jgi:hypothetical protein
MPTVSITKRSVLFITSPFGRSFDAASIRLPTAANNGPISRSRFAPRLADPLGSLLPHGDPLGEPCQVGTGSDEERGLERLALPLVPVLAGVEAERDPGPLGQQVAAAVGNLSQLSYRGLDLQRLPAYEATNSAGELGPGDPVRVRFAAGDSHSRTVSRIEQTF